MNFSQLLKLDNKKIQSLLKELDASQLVLALKGAKEKLSRKFFENMSDNASTELKQMMMKKASVPLNLIEKAQKNILNLAIKKGIMPKIKLALASDHAAFELKEHLKKYLSENYEIIDYGTNSTESMDYPNSGFKAAEAVSKEECELGIIMCGSGIGMSLVANKVKGIRAALCHCTDFAKLCRQHNNANMMVLPGRFISKYLAEQMVDIFLKTEFEGGRHQRRIDLITKYENRG